MKPILFTKSESGADYEPKESPVLNLVYCTHFEKDSERGRGDYTYYTIEIHMSTGKRILLNYGAGDLYGETIDLRSESTRDEDYKRITELMTPSAGKTNKNESKSKQP